MKFSFLSSKQKNEQQQQKKEKVILFVCVENAGRSQMAEGFFNRKYAPKGYRAISAGTRPASQINPLALQLNEVYKVDTGRQPINFLSRGIF